MKGYLNPCHFENLFTSIHLRNYEELHTTHVYALKYYKNIEMITEEEFYEGIECLRNIFEGTPNSISNYENYLLHILEKNGFKYTYEYITKESVFKSLFIK